MARNLTLRSAIQSGLIAGVVMIYLVAVGIASAFADVHARVRASSHVRH